jgi:hypothetical protein
MNAGENPPNGARGNATGNAALGVGGRCYPWPSWDRDMGPNLQLYKRNFFRLYSAPWDRAEWNCTRHLPQLYGKPVNHFIERLIVSIVEDLGATAQALNEHPRRQHAHNPRMPDH